jgi:hypothetical protein
MDKTIICIKGKNVKDPLKLNGTILQRLFCCQQHSTSSMSHQDDKYWQPGSAGTGNNLVVVVAAAEKPWQAYYQRLQTKTNMGSRSDKFTWNSEEQGEHITSLIRNSDAGPSWHGQQPNESLEPWMTSTNRYSLWWLCWQSIITYQ